MKTDGNGLKTPQLFSTSIFEYENKSENGKSGQETNTNLRNFENFENELIQAELCQTQSVYEKSTQNIDSLD